MCMPPLPSSTSSLNRLPVRSQRSWHEPWRRDPRRSGCADARPLQPGIEATPRDTERLAQPFRRPEPPVLRKRCFEATFRRVVRRRQRLLRCGAPRRRRRLPPSPSQFDPAPPIWNHAGQVPRPPIRSSGRCDEIDRLPLVAVRKRPTLTSFHPTPPGSHSQIIWG